MNTYNLEKCPFCGEEVHLSQRLLDPNYSITGLHTEDCFFRRLINNRDGFPTAKAAIEAWNKRAEKEKIREMKKGFWHSERTFAGKSYARICSSCGNKVYYVGQGNYPVCPYCLAEMDCEKTRIPTKHLKVEDDKPRYYDKDGNEYV